ncbi:transposase family protein [Hydrogenophilus sp. SS56]|uniref:transposase family protein n=1 Tax=Hydrogenophilus thiooxidans TaxID=2820326 RepID=UPI001C249A02
MNDAVLGWPMETGNKLRLADVFVSINDPRQAGKVKHDLVELLVVAVNAVLVGADTYGRLFGLIDPTGFEAAFRRWVGAILPALGADTVVAVDGGEIERDCLHKPEP